MTDVAALGLAIDSSDVVTATEALDRFNTEAAKSPNNVSRITTASDALIAALNRNTQATDSLTARMSAMEAAAAKTATSLTQVGQASERATTNVVQFNTAATKTRTELDATTAAVDKMTAAWQRLGSAGADVSKNLTPQGIAEFRLGNMSGNGTVPQQQQATPVTGGNTSGRLSAFQAQNLFYQGTDVIASAASGMSPLTIALQQGGQIAPTFMGPQGASIGGVIGQVGEGVMSLVSRIGLLQAGAATAAAAVAALVLANQNYASSQMAITRALVTGGGRLSGANANDINAIAAAGGGNLSTGSRRDYATQLAGAGVNVGVIGGITDTLKDFAATTGQDASSALAMLGQAFADPARGAETLNKQLGFLDANTLETIQRLQAQGDKLGAAKVLLDSYSSSLGKASELTSGWAQVTTAVLTPLANLWDKLGEKVNGALTGGSLDERISAMQNVLRQPKGFFESVSDSLGVGGRDGLQAELDKLTTQRGQQERRTQLAQQGQSSLELDATLKALNPQYESLKKLEDQAKAIRQPFMENWIDPNRQAQAALQGLAVQTKQMREDMAAGGAQYADAIRNAQFGLKTVGYAPEAQSIANINQQQDTKELEARRRAALDSSAGDYLDKPALERQLESIKTERDLLLQAERKRQEQATSNSSGAYAIGLAQVPEQYRSLVGTSATGQGISPGLLASLLQQESRYNPNAVSPAGAQGIAQFMPGTARGIGLSNPFDPSQAIPASARLLRQLLDSNGNDETAALVGYNAGPKVMQRFQRSGGDVSVLPAETRDYINKIMTPSPSAKANLEDQQQRQRQLEQEKQTLEALRQSGGENTAQYRAQVEVVNRLNDDLAKNRVSSTSLTAAYMAEAKARQDIQSATQFAGFVANDNFNRQQLGRTQDEQGAYSAARPYQGTQYYDQVLQRSRDTSDMQQTKQMVMDGATTFVSALRRGATASEALSQAFGNAADKLLNKALDGIISGGFGLLQNGGGGGGGFASLFKMGSDSGLPDFSFPSFSTGGYTGDGGRFDPAGIVHRGEVVFSQSDVARFGGAAVVERMRMGFPGYADGGIVGGGSAAGGGGGQTNIQVNMQGSSGDPQKDQAHIDNTVKALRDEMNTTWHQNLSKSLQTNGALWKAGVRRAS